MAIYGSGNNFSDQRKPGMQAVALPRPNVVAPPKVQSIGTIPTSGFTGQIQSPGAARVPGAPLALAPSGYAPKPPTVPPMGQMLTAAPKAATANAVAAMGLRPEGQRIMHTPSTPGGIAVNPQPARQTPGDGTVVVPTGTAASLQQPTQAVQQLQQTTQQPIYRNKGGTSFGDTPQDGGAVYTPGETRADAVPRVPNPAASRDAVNRAIASNDPAALRRAQEAPQSIARLPSSFSVAPGSAAFIHQQAAEIDRTRDAQLQRRDAQIDNSVARANRATAINDLENLQRVGPRTSHVRTGSNFTPRGTGAAQRDISQQIAQLKNSPLPNMRGPTAAEEQQQGVEAETEQQSLANAAVSQQTAQLNLQAEKRKAALGQQIAELGDATTPDAANLTAKLAALSGRDPNSDRFVPVEDIAGYDQFGAPIKVKSQYDTRTSQFLSRQGAAGPTPPPAAIKDLQADPKLAADFDAKYGSGSSARFLGG